MAVSESVYIWYVSTYTYIYNNSAYTYIYIHKIGRARTRHWHIIWSRTGGRSGVQCVTQYFTAIAIIELHIYQCIRERERANSPTGFSYVRDIYMCGPEWPVHGGGKLRGHVTKIFTPPSCIPMEVKKLYRPSLSKFWAKKKTSSITHISIFLLMAMLPLCQRISSERRTRVCPNLRL